MRVAVRHLVPSPRRLEPLLFARDAPHSVLARTAMVEPALRFPLAGQWEGSPTLTKDALARARAANEVDVGARTLEIKQDVTVSGRVAAPTPPLRVGLFHGTKDPAKSQLV